MSLTINVYDFLYHLLKTNVPDTVKTDLFFDLSNPKDLRTFIYDYLLSKIDVNQKCVKPDISHQYNGIMGCFNSSCKHNEPCVPDCKSCPITTLSKNIDEFLSLKNDEKIVDYYYNSRISSGNFNNHLTTNLIGGINITTHIFTTDYLNVLAVIIYGESKGARSIVEKLNTYAPSKFINYIKLLNNIQSSGDTEAQELKDYFQTKYNLDKDPTFEYNMNKYVLYPNAFIVPSNGLTFTQLIKTIKLIKENLPDNCVKTLVRHRISKK